MNSFSLGAQVGGSDNLQAIAEQQLRDLFNGWRGDYTDAIREFAFILRVDGSIEKYTEIWNIRGAQPAKRKRDWIEVEVGIPLGWCRDMRPEEYKLRLSEEVEKGLVSMVALLRRNRHRVNADALLSDWNRIRTEFLSSTHTTRESRQLL